MKTFFGITFQCKAVVLTTGTFMNGRIWVGRTSMPAGRLVSTLLATSRFLPFNGLKECESLWHILHTASAQPHMCSQNTIAMNILLSSEGRRGTLYRANRGADGLKTQLFQDSNACA